MKTLYKILLTFIASFFFNFCFSQQQKIDSLLLLIKHQRSDTLKIQRLGFICSNFRLIGKYDSARFYGNTAIDIGKELADENTPNSAVYLTAKRETAKTYNNIGITYENESNYDKARECYLLAKKLYESISYKKGIASSFNNIGNVDKALGHYDQALKNYLASLKIKEETNDKKGMAGSFNNIGIIYYDRGNMDLALVNYQNAQKIYSEINDKPGLANCYTNLGSIYRHKKNQERALESFEAALKIYLEISDKQNVALCYNNIGSVCSSKHNYTDALKNHLASLKIRKEIGNKQGIAASYNNIGDVYSIIKDYQEALSYLLKGLEIGKQINSKEDIRQSYKLLAKTYALSAKYALAYENHLKYSEINDSLFNEEGSKKIAEMNVRYETEKKEQQIRLIKTEQEKERAISISESKKQQLIILFAIVIAFSIALIAIVIFRSLRITRQQKNTIELQRNEVQEQKEVIEIHQKEIIDSITYAKRLQDAILPPIGLIKKYLPNNFVIYKPKDIVAGDFYWLETNGDTVFIAAADCTGHGVPGAMVSVVCSNALNRTIKEFKLSDTGKILDKTRELVLETFEKSSSEVKDGMDISLLSIDYKNKRISWSGANNPLWYILPSSASHQNEIVLHEIKANKQPIGKSDFFKPFTTHTIEYVENTTFYLFTDGLADQFGGQKGKKFKYKQLSYLLTKHIHLSPQQQAEIIENEFKKWKGDLEQVDDICIIGIKI